MKICLAAEGGDMQTTDNVSGQQARMINAEEHLRQNAADAHQIAQEIAVTLHRIAPSLPNRPEVFVKDRNSEQEYDVRYHVGIARTFRAGLFRKFRFKLLQIHLHGNFKSVVARVTAPEGHAYEDGISLASPQQAAEIFSEDYLRDLLKGQVNAADEAYLTWKLENRGLSLRRIRH